MYRITLLLILSTTANAGWFSPSNYWECVLDRMPSAQNKIVARAINNQCRNDFKSREYEPAWLAGTLREKALIEARKNLPWGIKTTDECVIKYATKAPDDLAARHIRRVCHELYPTL